MGSREDCRACSESCATRDSSGGARRESLADERTAAREEGAENEVARKRRERKGLRSVRASAMLGKRETIGGTSSRPGSGRERDRR